MNMTAKTDEQKQPTIAKFIRAIRSLPSDALLEKWKAAD